MRTQEDTITMNVKDGSPLVKQDLATKDSPHTMSSRTHADATDFYVSEHDDSTFHLSINMPGVKAHDIKVQVQDGILKVTGVRTFPPTKQICNSYALDYFAVDVTKLTANLADGVLVLTAPKKKGSGIAHNVPITQHAHGIIEPPHASTRSNEQTHQEHC